jgi:hypothetical protein
MLIEALANEEWARASCVQTGRPIRPNKIVSGIGVCEVKTVPHITSWKGNFPGPLVAALNTQTTFSFL